MKAAAVPVGARVSVDPGGKLGEVMFVGKVEGLPLGWWVGVRLDEPSGKNAGSVKAGGCIDNKHSTDFGSPPPHPQPPWHRPPPSPLLLLLLLLEHALDRR